MMDTKSIDGSWIVQDLVEEYPAVMPVFVDWKLDCLGCSMAPFCTLEEVAEDYHLDLEHFLQDVRRAVA